MRNILYRGKTKDGKWVYGFLIKGTRTYIATCNAIEYMVVSLMGRASLELVEVIPETVGEYTGLCDKNGNKIFEGDIVDVEYAEVNGVVIFDEYSRFVVTSIMGYYLLGHIDDACEVIGNIIDNKNLLED